MAGAEHGRRVRRTKAAPASPTPPGRSPAPDPLRFAERARPGGGTRGPVGGWPIFIAIVIVVAFLFLVRAILLPFVFAAAIAFILTPLVDQAARRLGRLPRWIAAVGVYLLLLLTLAGLGYWLGRLIAADIAEIADTAPQIVRRTVTMLIGANAEFLGQQIDAGTVSREIIAAAKSFLLSSMAMSIASTGLIAVFGGFLCAVLLLYFLISGRRIVSGTLWLVPPEHRPEVAAMLRKISPMLWRYLAGLCAIVIYTSSTAGIGFGLLFRLPHAALLALAVGLMELVPVIGPATSALFVAVAALQEGSLVTAAALAGFAVALRLSIDQIVGPILLGRAASVHPVVIIFCFLSGAVVFGVIGLVLAVPVAATIRLVLAHYYAEPIEG